MPRKQKEYEQQLEGFVMVECSIECTKCKNGDVAMVMDEMEGEEYFYFEGWRAKEDDCYCPKCAKKYKVK